MIDSFVYNIDILNRNGIVKMTHLDITKKFNEITGSKALIVSGDGSNVLIFRKLDNLFKRADGVMARYEVEYRWLSEPVDTSVDSFACVLGSEFTYYTLGEVREVIKSFRNKKNDSVNLFNHFNLF